MPLKLTINGQERSFAGLGSPATLAQVVAEMSLKGDRIAVELNGMIAQRAHWAAVQVRDDDRLEIVHFVGGGAELQARSCER